MKSNLKVTILTTAFSFLFLVGCSQSVKKVKIKAKSPSTPTPFTYISTTDIQGTTSTIPTSSSVRLSIHSLGGNSQRTVSTSSNFKINSGSGVD